jgi:DNA-binding MarR family transcriptional regulator
MRGTATEAQRSIGVVGSSWLDPSTEEGRVSDTKNLEKLVKVLSLVSAEDAELPLKRLRILLYVYSNGPMSGVDIEEALEINRPNMWGHLGNLSIKHNRMRGLGFVEITDDPKDPRAKRIEITSDGRKFVNKLLEAL